MKIFIRVASNPDKDDPTILDPILATESWHTLVTFARESAREHPVTLSRRPLFSDAFLPSSPAAPVPGRAIVRRPRVAPHGRRHPARALRSDRGHRRERRHARVPALHVRERAWRARLRGVRAPAELK